MTEPQGSVLSGLCPGRPSRPPRLTRCERSTHAFLGLSSGKVRKPLASVWLTKCYQFILKFTLASSLWSHQTRWNILSFVLKCEDSGCVADGMGFHRGAEGSLRGSGFLMGQASSHFLLYKSMEGVGAQTQLESRGSSNLESCCLANTPPPMAPKENSNQPSV